MTTAVKFFKIIDPRSNKVDITDNSSQTGGLYGNYTWYSRLVHGSANRVHRYREYDLMDNDVDVARALDIIAEEIVGNNPKTQMPLEIFVQKEGRTVPSRLVVTLNAALKTWCTINEWQHKLFTIARHTVKYGDCFFARPKKKNGKLEYIPIRNLIGAVVSELDFTDIRGWHIKVDSKHTDQSGGNNMFFNVGASIGDAGVQPFNAEDILRFTLNDDMSEEAPFGSSILRAAYRTFKQKELLEDSLIIYRIVRAPERLVFKIATGKMPPNRVAQHLEQVKNEITQKKVPSSAGGNDSIESVYSPHSMSKNYFFAQPADGQGSSVEVLPGGCLDLSTRIPLLDGRILTLSDMIDEHRSGKVNWIYSVDPSTGKPLPGIVSWAGITNESADVYEIELDNGDTFVVTGDHQHPIVGRGMVETVDLCENDCFVPYVETDLSNETTTEIFDNLDRKINADIITILRHYVDVGNDDIAGVLDKLNSIDRLVVAWNFLNATVNTKTFSEFQENDILNVLSEFGYDGWEDFKAKRDLTFIDHVDGPQYLVKSVTKLDFQRPVGTLTIDQHEQYNKFHTFAIMLGDSDTVGLYTKNSGLGELADLEYFFKKMWRGLRIPQSYMDNTTEGGAVANDGKVGIAYLQEIKFAQYIERLQRYLEKVFDEEFKKFLYDAGIIVDHTMFKVILPQPSNWSVSKQQQMDSELINTYGQVDGIKHISKRFALGKYLQLTEAEMALNERLLAEERGLNPDHITIFDLPKIYAPEDAEAGGFEGGLGGMGGGGGGGGPPLGDMEMEGGDEGGMGDDDGMGDTDPDADDAPIDGDDAQPPDASKNSPPPPKKP